MVTKAQKIKNRELALASLRNAPESQRAMGTAISPDGKMCACAFLAKPLGISLSAGMLTVDLIEKIAEKTDIPLPLLSLVPNLNDKEKGIWYIPAHSFTDIAKTIEDEINRMGI